MTYEKAAQIILNTWWANQPWDMEDCSKADEIIVVNIWDEAMKLAYDTLMEKANEES